MELRNLIYLLLLLSYLVFPLILSFRNKTSIIFRVRNLLPAILFSGVIFIMWDIRFTELGIWTYNPDYLTGILILKIPVEKWLSLIIIPLSATYIYEWLKPRLEKPGSANFFVVVSLALFVTTGILAYVYRRNMFSFFTFFLTAIYLGYTVFRNRFKKYYCAFYLAFVVTLLPFIFVSAFEGTLPVIAYSTDQIMGLALFRIPIEKIVYLYLILLINLTIYEYLNERRFIKTQ